MKQLVRAISLLWVLCVFCGPVWAVRLHSSGFETNDLLATEWNAAFAGGTPVLQTTTVHSGTYAIDVTTSAGSEGVRRTRGAGSVTSGTFFLRTYFRCSTFPNTTVTVMNTRASGAGATALRVNFVTSSNVIRLRNNITTTEQTGSATLSTNTWYRLEARHLISDTVGEMELRLFSGDSTTALETLSITGEDTLPGNIQDFDFGFPDATTATCYYDDTAINDATGSFQTSWPGPGKIIMRTPASDDTVQWTRQGAGCTGVSNAACVDDEPGLPDDATTYNDNGTSGNSDRLNSSAMPAEVPSDADIILVDVMARFGGSGTTGTRLCRVDLWDEASAQSSGADSSGCDSATWTLMSTSFHLVFDAGARTKANLDDPDFDIGYTNRSAHSNRVTALWANVEWTEAPAAPQVMPYRKVVLE